MQYKAWKDKSNLAGVEYSSLILEGIKHLCKQIRPVALHLVECYEIDDSILQSAIGNSYGDIYETQFEWAKNSRLNDDKGSIPKGFHEHLLLILKDNFDLLRSFRSQYRQGRF